MSFGHAYVTIGHFYVTFGHAYVTFGHTRTTARWLFLSTSGSRPKVFNIRVTCALFKTTREQDVRVNDWLRGVTDIIVRITSGAFRACGSPHRLDCGSHPIEVRYVQRRGLRRRAETADDGHESIGHELLQGLARLLAREPQRGRKGGLRLEHGARGMVARPIDAGIEHRLHAPQLEAEPIGRPHPVVERYEVGVMVADRSRGSLGPAVRSSHRWLQSRGRRPWGTSRAPSSFASWHAAPLTAVSCGPSAG